MVTRFWLLVAISGTASACPAYANDPGPDGRCHFPNVARDSQGFCWKFSWNVTQADARYAQMRASGLTPPSPNVGSVGSMHIPSGTDSAIGQANLRNCLQLAQNGFGTEDQCRAGFNQSTEASNAVRGVSNMAAQMNPMIAAAIDPNGAFCDKATEMAFGKIPFVGERLALLAKSYGLYDTIRRGFQQRQESLTFKDKVLEACHLK